MRKSILTALMSVAMVAIPAACATATAVKASKTAQQTDNQMWPAVVMISTLRPLMPPLALIWSAAHSTPRL